MKIDITSLIEECVNYEGHIKNKRINLDKNGKIISITSKNEWVIVFPKRFHNS